MGMSEYPTFSPFETEDGGAFQGLYLHVPFCVRKCPYCDFNTYAGQESLYEAFSRALAQEIREVGERLGRPRLQTVFIGGGTPTVLSSEELARILQAVHEAFVLPENAEITSEANPGTVDREKFEHLYHLGVNRLSIGAQSFDDRELRFLGRIHDVTDIYRAVETARLAGFVNLNLDLIYGLPQQSVSSWEHSLRSALSLHPEHLSCYALTVEEGTPLYRWMREGRVPPIDEDRQAELYLLAEEILAEAGYVHYEISNWARSGYECAHNLIYWRNEPYLGLGPGAHSYNGHYRWWTVRHPLEYIRRVHSGESTIAGWEEIGRETGMGETMMLGLRLLVEGVDRKRFRERFGRDPVDVYGSTVRRLEQWGLIDVQMDRLRLTPRARLVANQVFQEFLLVV